MAKYFVKFVPYNNNTLSGLINRTVKYSTVYEFNDFNELHFIAPLYDRNKKFYQSEDFNALVKRKLGDDAFKCEVLKYMFYQNYTKDFRDRASEYIRSTNFGEQSIIPTEYSRFLLELMVFNSIGIFSVSHIDVFEDDAAQLMFAHYADNLKGLALIYQIDSLPSQVKYPAKDKNIENSKPPSSYALHELLEWCDAERVPDDFLNKSKYWKYEKEFRLIGKPGIVSTKVDPIVKTVNLLF